MYIQSNKDPGTFEHVTLSNGISLYFQAAEQRFGAPKVAGCVVVNVGGRDDPAGKEGAAHFFEHMPFRGTEHYPNIESLTTPIENNGGYMNAFTSDEVTGYEVIVPTSMLEDGVSRLSDMLQYPLLREDDIPVERQVIIEELRNKWASVGFYARRELYKRLLGDHPLVYAVIGTESALNSITKSDLASFHETYYKSQNITLFFAGQMDKDTLVQLCETYFGELGPGQKTLRNISSVKTSNSEHTVVLAPKEYNRSQYVLGRLLPTHDYFATIKTRIFTQMLTRGMNSPLYREIREKRGLAYSLRLGQEKYSDLTILSFSVQTHFAAMDEVEKVVWEQFLSITEDEARFVEVRDAMIQGALYAEYGTSGLLDYGIDSFIDYNEIIPLEKHLQSLAALTLKDIQEHVKHWFKREEFVAIRVNCEKPESNS